VPNQVDTLPPIVLYVQARPVSQRSIVADTPTAKLVFRCLYGVEPRIELFKLTTEERWWLNPLDGRNLFPLLEQRPEMTLAEARELVATDTFMEFVREYLIVLLSTQIQTDPSINLEWLESIKLVVLGEPFIEIGSHLQQVFRKLFPHAHVVMNDAKAADEATVAKPFGGHSLDVVLIEEIDLSSGSLPRGARAYHGLKRAGIMTVGELVSYTPAQLKEKISQGEGPDIGPKTLAVVEAALAEHGLALRKD